ncbi:MAG: hypothetical protein ACRD9R_16605 [Pyrinomonadaceae bacterium]
MSLEFAVQYPCPLRARYPEEHLRAWGRLSNIHTRVTTGEALPPSEEKMRFVERAGAELDRMREETHICETCPAHLPREAAGEGERVGCLGRINYPIEAQFEKFVADRTQLALDTVAPDDQPRLLRILVDADTPFDGEGTKSLRQVTTPQNLRFFELRLPIRLTREAVHLTTDHVFDALSGFTAQDAKATTYARELPCAAAPDYYDFLDLLLRHDLTASEHERLHRRSKNYKQFLRLLAALERAEALRTRVLLD